MVLLALIAGATLRLWFIHSYPEVQGDPLVYGSIAKNWMLHGVYGTTTSGSLLPTLIRLPGYPLFLMLCFRLFGMEHYHAVMYAQTAIDLGTCLLIAAFTRRIWSERAAWWALWLAVLCPFTANYAATPLTETLELFSIAVSVYALVRFLEHPGKLWAAVSALGWSYAALLRPDGALLAVALFPAVIWYGRKRWGVARMLRYAFAVGTLSVLPFVPWAIRNWRTFHVVQPLAPRYATDPGEDTNPGFQRWTKTVCADLTCTWEIYWNIDSDVVDPKTLPSRAFDTPAERTATEQLLADYNKSTSLTPALDDRFGELAAQRIERNPLRYYVVLPLVRVADMWLRPRTELLWIELRWWQYGKHHAETRFAIAYAALNLFYLVLGLFGLRKNPPLAAAFVLFILLRCALLATIEAPEPRYTLECFPMIIALGAIALSGRKAITPEPLSFRTK
ncbi:ArnT family glycosyltransferase [Silvibacterium acidisoli]|uniref:ArnT family glycosyltransferase n=1 Tax=Acidobacteriaceae bacterium ZG23-2 TaxID=2883246 RepID=UPI00406D0C93